jgi:hypothetical protein
VTLVLEANPTSIPADGGEALITIRATGDGGAPVDDGTQILLTTSLGTINSPVTTTGGVAHGTLKSTGQAGKAVVTAIIGAAAPVTVEVTIGLSPMSLFVTADPTELSTGGGNSTITAKVYGENQVPLGGVLLVFSASHGTLSTNSAQVTTDGSGTAVDTLSTEETSTVTATLVDYALSDSATVTVGQSNIGGILVTANPVSFDENGGDSSLLAFVWDLSDKPLPNVPVIFSVDPYGAGTLADKNAVLTNAAGEAANTVTVTASAMITANVGVESADVEITVAEVDPTFRVLSLSPYLTYLDNPPVPPAGTECDPSAQLPVQITATLVDQNGDPVADEWVNFYFLKDSDPDTHDHYGGFCPDLGSVESIKTDAGGNAVAEFSFSFDDLTECLGFTSDYCRTQIRAFSGSTMSESDVYVTVLP